MSSETPRQRGAELRPPGDAVDVGLDVLDRERHELVPRPRASLAGLGADAERPLPRVDPGRRPRRQHREVVGQVLPGRQPRVALAPPRAEASREDCHRTLLLVGCSHAHRNAPLAVARERIPRRARDGCRDTRCHARCEFRRRVYAGRAPHRELSERTSHVHRIIGREVGHQRHPHRARRRRRPRRHRRYPHPLPARQDRGRRHRRHRDLRDRRRPRLRRSRDLLEARRAAGRASATSPSASCSSSRASSRWSTSAQTTAWLAIFVGILVGIMWIVEGIVALSTLGDAASKGWSIFFAIISIIAGLYLLFSPLVGRCRALVAAGHRARRARHHQHRARVHLQGRVLI